MVQKSQKKKWLFAGILFCLAMFVIVIFYLLLRNTIFVSKNNKLRSVEVVGFSLNQEFINNVYEYDVLVDIDKVQIKCDSDEEMEGCNTVVDLSRRNNYVHNIKAKDENNNEYNYKINIIKDLNKTNDDLRISSIEGIPLKWTNKDVKLVVNAVYNKDKGIFYSFDGGVTFSENNSVVISKNQMLQIVLKNNDGELSSMKMIPIDRIDKNSPVVSIAVKEQSQKKNVLEAIVTDDDSGVVLYSWNNSTFTNNKVMSVSNVGRYILIAKDRAGNVSKPASIVLGDSNFNNNKEITRSYAVNYVDNGATVAKKSDVCTTTKETCKVTLPTISRSGAEILGFSTDKYSTKAQYKVGDTITLDDSITLYAITKKTLKTTFVANGATYISDDKKTCTIYNSDNSCIIQAPSIKREAGVALGWSTNKNAITPNYSASASVQIYDNVTLYAITYVNYKVNLNKNGASSIGKTQLTCKAYNSSDGCLVTLPSITNSGGSVSGWSTDKDAMYETYKVNSQITVKKDMTLYAITGQSLKATFVVNGATSIGAAERVCVSRNGKTCNITTPSISVTDGTVIGWSTSKDSTTAQYKVNTSISLDSSKTFYAITSKTYTLSFDANGATSIGATQKKCTAYNGGSCKVTLPTIIRDGGTVVGWNTDKDATTSKWAANKEAPVKATTTLYAITYKVNKLTFDANGADSISSTKSYSCNAYNKNSECAIKNLYMPVIYKKGHVAIKYNTKKDNTGKWYWSNKTHSSFSIGKSITLYAIWNDKELSGSLSSMNVGKSFMLDGLTVDVEAACGSSNVYVDYLNKVYNKGRYLLKSGKAFVLTDKMYLSRYNNSGSVAVTLSYGGPYPIFLYRCEKDSYNAVVHELAHGWDHYYGYRTGKKIREQDDFLTIYNYYKKNASASTPLSAAEYFAAMTTYYYFHIANTNEGIKSDHGEFGKLPQSYKNKLKCAMESYISVTNNDFNTAYKKSC